MKVFGLIVLILLLVAGVAVYIDGARLPLDHSVSVTGVVAAPPEKVFSLITNVAKVSEWRPGVKFVTVFHDQDRDHWVEHLDHGQFQTFIAVHTDPIKPADPAAGPDTVVARREVALDNPKGSYGGSWTYELFPGPEPATTTLKITETGFIRPPLYRFVAMRILGPTRNLDRYMKDIQAAAARP
jgi:hypothetical protein